ncbi:MAG: twin-arginine translocase TatA/TatE family subunit [Candidatus Bathyarchaeia archaeon]|jgi:sec-independent protein translocase protein TatA
MDGMEWIIIGVVAIVIILWGPGKIPEFAKSLGRAKGEFEKASHEFTASAGSPIFVTSKDVVLLDTAKGLGIATDGKTRAQISEEISLKAKQLGAD